MIATKFALVLLSAAAFVASAGAIDADIIGNIILPAPGICGINPGGRIKGDIKTPINSFPWTALIIIRPIDGGEAKIICGGSLISDEIILTSASCIKKIPEGIIAKIRLGEWDIIGEQNCIEGQKCGDKPIEIDIEKIIINKEYDGEHIHNDIAIIKIAKKIIFTEYIAPICLPIADDIRIKADIDTIFTIIGWGINEIGQPGIIGNRYKQAIDIIGKDKEICRAKNPIIQDTEICAAGDAGIDICIGDAGGALVAPEADGIWYQYGIIIGKECGGIGIPGIFTRIISYIDWIQKIIK